MNTNLNEFAKTPSTGTDSWTEAEQIALRAQLEKAEQASTGKPMTSDEFDAWLKAQ